VTGEILIVPDGELTSVSASGRPLGRLGHLVERPPGP